MMYSSPHKKSVLLHLRLHFQVIIENVVFGDSFREPFPNFFLGFFFFHLVLHVSPHPWGQAQTLSVLQVDYVLWKITPRIVLGMR